MVKQVLSVKLEPEEITKLKALAELNKTTVTNLILAGLQGMQNHDYLMQQNKDLEDQVKRLQQETGRTVRPGKRISCTIPIQEYQKLSMEAAAQGRPLAHLLKDKLLSVQRPVTPLALQ